VSLLVATIFWKYVEEPAKRASKRVTLRAPFLRRVSIDAQLKSPTRGVNCT
jgi:peptidoglycan/LPS O-acetylase OafA/YrhL